MRLGRWLLLLALASGVLVACADESPVSVPRGADGLYAGGGSGAASPSDGERSTAAGDAGGGADSGLAGLTTVEPPPDAAVTVADAAAAAVEPDAAVASDAAEPSDGGCACGCTDPCLTELIAACKAPTVLLLAVCPKVPATCACEATCTTPAPTAPSLDACVAQFLLTGG
jgi:hypothetical protein